VGEAIWKEIISEKYLKRRLITNLIRVVEIGIRKGSFIWLSFQKIKLWFLRPIKWAFGKGNMIIITR